MTTITPYLFLGDANDAKNLSFLQSKNIKLIVNAAEEIPNYFTNYFQYINLKWNDIPRQDIIRGLVTNVTKVLKEINSGNAVFVHCAAGISRSAIFTIYTLMKLNNWDYKRAYSYVKSLRHIINPNSGFVEQVLKLQPSHQYWASKNHNVNTHPQNKNDNFNGNYEIINIEEQHMNNQKQHVNNKNLVAVANDSVQLINNGSSNNLYGDTQGFILIPKSSYTKYKIPGVDEDLYENITKSTENSKNNGVGWNKLTFDSDETHRPTYTRMGKGLYANIFK